MENKKLEALGRVLEVLDRLRVECPWDRDQTMESLRNCTIEETFELADAVADRDYDGIRQELGDLLLHVVFYAKIADEEGRFDISNVADSLCDKLIFRHPHVFGTVEADNPRQVKYNWEQLKLKEKKRARGILGGVPRSLPAMVKAFRIGEKAASAGFDWEKKEDVWDKVREEVGEVEREIAAVRVASNVKQKDSTAVATGGEICGNGNSEAVNDGGSKDDIRDIETTTRDSSINSARDRMESEFGDLFFALVNAARLYGVDPEMALERTNKKFIRRFNHIEERAAAVSTPLKDLSLSQMEEWWQEAKENHES